MKPEQMYYDNIYLETEWKKEFSWLPKKCYKSGKLIWLTEGYRGELIYKYSGIPHYAREIKWLNKKMYIMLKLKGEI